MNCIVKLVIHALSRAPGGNENPLTGKVYKTLKREEKKTIIPIAGVQYHVPLSTKVSVPHNAFQRENRDNIATHHVQIHVKTDIENFEIQRTSQSEVLVAHNTRKEGNITRL